MATFNANQHDAFFLNGPQMSLTPAVRFRLAQEGLTIVDDFSDFKEDQLDQAFKNMRTSIPAVAGIPAILDANNANAVLIPAIQGIAAIPPILVSAKCALRLNVASKAYHYYVSVGRTPSPSNMNYSNVLKSFHIENEALSTLSDESKPDVPLLHKNQTPLKWIESFKDCLFRTYGIRGCPLLYVVRDDANVTPEVDDPLALGFAYGESGSVLDELIARLTHTDPLYKSDNATVYSLLEEATRGSVYASTIKPYARKKDGRSAWMSMVSSHAGKDKWEQLQKDRTKFMMNSKWNGRTFSLEKFTGLHRTSFVQLQEAALHVNFQLPTEHTRVGYLLDNMENSDPDLRAAIASIRINTNGMRDNFEDSVAFLLPVDPYSKNRSTKQKNPQISDVKLQGKAQSTTGVDLRYYKYDEYIKLNKEQKNELYMWQSTKEGKAIVSKQKAAAGIKGKGQASKNKWKAKVSALESKLKDLEDEGPSIAEIQACIAAVAPTIANPAASTPSDPTYQAYALAVKKILKRKRE